MAILTLSRKVGSGTREIGMSVAKALKYEFVSIREIQSRMQAVGEQWEELGKTFDECYPKLLDRHDSSFAGYVALAQWIVLSCAVKNNVVIISRGSNFLLKGIPYAFRVRVTAPTEERVERVMTREGVRRDAAAMIIQKADYEMSRSISYIYGKDWNDPVEYDAVIDTCTTTISEIVDNLIEELIRRDDIRTKAMRRALVLRAKAYEIRACLLTNPKLFMPILDVHPQEEGLVLRGVADNTLIAERVEDVAQRVAGDIPIKVNIYSRR
jgi:cytidylate kinase